MYILDTNIIATLLLEKNPSDREIEIRNWILKKSDSLYICTISITEMEAGVAKAERQGAVRKARDLSLWLDSILETYADRLLVLDVHSARVAGRLLDKAYAAGGMPDFEDAAIAAIAQTREFNVLTRNERHFRLFGVSFINPYDSLP